MHAIGISTGIRTFPSLFKRSLCNSPVWPQTFVEHHEEHYAEPPGIDLHIVGLSPKHFGGHVQLQDARGDGGSKEKKRDE